MREDNSKDTYQHPSNKTKRTTIWIQRLQCLLHQAKKIMVMDDNERL